MSTYTKLDSYKSHCCGALLMKHGKVARPQCSKCGKVWEVDFPSSAKRRNHMLLIGIPEAHGILGKYEVPEHPGYWVVAKKYQREVEPKGKDRLPDGHIFAIEGTTVLELKREEKK